METIIAAAIKYGDLICMTERPGRHHSVLWAMDKCGLPMRGETDAWRNIPEEQGFVTSAGRFVGREEGRKIAEAAAQLIACQGEDGVPFVREHTQLFSEDVW